MIDHKASYAHHIAQAIRHKQAMRDAEQREKGFNNEGDRIGGDDNLPAEDDINLADEVPVDSKAARKERIKAILAR